MEPSMVPKPLFLAIAATLFMSVGAAQAVEPPAAAAPAAAAPAVPGAKVFSAGELEQLAAPIALYPDELIANIFMGATYPIDIVQADRFAKANKNLKGDQLTAALNKQPWDESIKSLVSTPTIL